MITTVLMVGAIPTLSNRDREQYPHAETGHQNREAGYNGDKV